MQASEIRVWPTLEGWTWRVSRDHATVAHGETPDQLGAYLRAIHAGGIDSSWRDITDEVHRG